MSAGVILGVGLLGGVGAIARFLLDGAVSGHLGRDFPYGTLAVNLTGSLLFGVLVGAALDTDDLRLAGTGLIGAFTTFSTWAFESHRLSEDGQGSLGALNFAVSILLGVAAAWLGREIGMTL
ncbi:MAG: fluoride efflux transporter CrcB [Actinomycetota bacterium]|nr:fluoride efflux transporter CrcB [Actinomycetota bacterium]